MFKPGDIVLLKDQEGRGKVISYEAASGKVLVEMDGMDFEFLAHQIIHIDGSTGSHIPTPLEDKINKALTDNNKVRLNRNAEIPGIVYKPVFSRTRNKKNDLVAIDLHLEELLDSVRNPEGLAKIEIQLYVFKSTLEEAFEKKIGKFIIIHGVGKGVLKKEIEKIVSGYSNIIMQPASMEKYGIGASMIEIRGLHAGH